MNGKLLRFFSLSGLAALALGATAAELRVSTDFEGGSARVESIDSTNRVIRFMPGGDPARGWPCWWYFRVDGLASGEPLALEIAGSDLSSRNNGTNTGKPLATSWAAPLRVTYSTDGQTWEHSGTGARAGTRIRYKVTGAGGALWVAWGPPFTPRDTEALLKFAAKKLPVAKSFELAQTRAGRPVRGLHVNESSAAHPPVIWVNARQHAWESGGSWVARGFTEWLVSDDADARWLRGRAEVFIVPIMDVDNVVTGDGGKEADPHDHNRDWDDHPIFPEVAAAQQRLREFVREERLDLFLDLHNPSASDLRPFFFIGPTNQLGGLARTNLANFLASAGGRINGPLPLAAAPRMTGPAYHPLWRQISAQWVSDHGNPQTVSACLETSWNATASTTEGYRTVGKQLGLAVADFMRRKPIAP